MKFLLNDEETFNLNNVPKLSGCYLFFDINQKYIYIGKALNLKSRIKNYFPLSKKKWFGKIVKGFEIIITNNEKDALILEQNLIKKHNPFFNVSLKDDQYYPYLQITSGDNPNYKLVYKINKANLENYYGPFPDGSKVRKIIQLLENYLPLAKCKGKLGKPCFYYTINRCSGHCFKKVDFEYYDKIKKNINSFFKGNVGFLRQKINNSMKLNIKNLNFEIAKKEKEILDKLNFLTDKQYAEFKKKENIDFLGIFLKEGFISFYLLIYRYGELMNHNEGVFPVIINSIESEKKACFDYIYQFYKNNSEPKFFYISENYKFLKKHISHFNFSIKISRSVKEKRIIEMAENNAKENWKNKNLKDFEEEKKNDLLIKLSNFLNINTPYNIEFLDISNIQNFSIVAAFLVIKNGQQNMKNSNVYVLNEKNIKDKSDISRIKYACNIRYSSLNQKNMPDLIVVDGGKEQLKAVDNSLKQIGLFCNIISLAKDKKHKTDRVITMEFELKLEEGSLLKKFFSKYQENVHNYAISFHRKLHVKTSLKYFKKNNNEKQKTTN